MKNDGLREVIFYYGKKLEVINTFFPPTVSTISLYSKPIFPIIRIISLPSLYSSSPLTVVQSGQKSTNEKYIFPIFLYLQPNLVDYQSAPC